MTAAVTSTLTLQQFDDELGRDPLGLMDRLRDTAPVVAFPLGEGRRLLVSNDPAVSTAALAHGERTHRGLLRELVGPGLFVVASGEAWRERRALLRPLFSAHAAEGRHSVVLAAAEDFVRRVLAPSAGSPLALGPAMQQLSVEIILRLVVPEVGDDEFADLSRALLSMVEYLDQRLFDPELLAPGDEERFAADKSALVDSINRGRKPKVSGTGLLGELVGRIQLHEGWSEDYRRQILVDEILSVFVAGVETMGALFTWLLWNLDAHPAQAQACADEARSEVFEGLAADTNFPREALPSLQANVLETLRLTPPAWALFRSMPRELEVNGLTLRAGDEVLAATWSIHRDPAYWDDPDAYRPERFAAGPPLPGRYFPFGAGPHQCIGRELSIMNAQLAVGTVLRAGTVVVEGDKAQYRLKPAIALHLEPSPTATFWPRAPLTPQSSGPT